MMGKRQVAQEELFYEFSLERHVPADHWVRGIDRFIDLSESLDQPNPRSGSHAQGPTFSTTSTQSRRSSCAVRRRVYPKVMSLLLQTGTCAA